MASLQERRALLDNWNIREQLCLASAVSCSGDQNWMSVSRSLKTVCTQNNNEGINRPADWFSQKSCALQYAHLLENVETSKRKKRSSEGNSSPTAVVEIPTDLVLRRLTEERIQELKNEIRKDQEEYAKIYADLQKIQFPQFNEDMLQEMWREIEHEQESQRIAEMKMENQLREREQNRVELQRNWRLSGATKPESAVVDMDVEEIIGVTKSVIPPQQVQQPTSTSPLLSSLLKSPTSTAPPALGSSTSMRTNAPTITTLLTSGSIPNANQPAITLNSNLIPPEKAVQLLSRPITGPPVADSLSSSNVAAQNLLSPSQSAPTLSMLLERNKTVSKNQQTTDVTSADTNENFVSTSDSKIEELPIETQEEKKTATNEAIIDSDEPDPNEEQQLLEVFKNIGNIDELDIDVSVIDQEVDFLKGVDESPTNEQMDFGEKLDTVEKLTTHTEQSNFEQPNEIPDAGKTLKDEPNTDSKNNATFEVIKIETSSDDSNDNIPLAAVATLEHKERGQITPTAETVEKISNGNDFLNDKVEAATPKNVIDNAEQNLQETTTDITTTSTIKLDRIQLETDEHKIDRENAEQKSFSKNENNEIIAKTTTVDADIDNNLSQSQLVENEKLELFPTTTGDDKLLEQELAKTNTTKDEDNKSDAQLDNENDIESSTSNAAATIDEPLHDGSTINNDDIMSTIPLPPPSIISIADTDEDSCTTDISIVTPKRNEQSTSTTSSIKQNTDKTRKTSSYDAAAKSTDDSDSGSTNRASKRSLLNILNNLTSSKSAQTIQRVLNDDQLKIKYQKVCYRHLDFQTIKKNIENGIIRTTIELQRELLQITQNIFFLFQNSNATYKAAEIFKHEMQNIREFLFNSHEFETKTEKEVRDIKQAAKQVRTGSRKSQRIA